jgi:hypothetical protein
MIRTFTKKIGINPGRDYFNSHGKMGRLLDGNIQGGPLDGNLLT